ncbi:MAG: carbohydrate kinase, partial [Acidobacteria bacterium]|nr:carbohydrate kinase [Acidobacteriota bacterium]
MEGQPVVMVVDLVADRFITGIPKRISREAPVLILEFESETLTPGGGANALANIRSLGGVPLGVGVLGDDENGRSLLEKLTSMGVETDGLLVRKGYRTPTKTRILGGGRHSIKQQIVRYDVEEKLELRADEIAALEDALRRFRGRSAVAVLSDYGYGAVSPALMTRVKEALG